MKAADGPNDLFGVLTEMVGDIIITTDAEGFIEDGSTGLAALGYDLSRLLIHPHISNLARQTHAQKVRDYFRLALRCVAPVEAITFPIAANNDGDDWYSLSLCPVPSGGMLGVMRLQEQGSRLRGKLHSLAMTDQLTGLPNRSAFEMFLSEALVTNQRGVVVLIELDHFRAITLRFGFSMGDEVIAAFGHFLSVFGSAGGIIARIEAERFAVFLPAHELGEAYLWTQDVIATFGNISEELGFSKTKLSASAGLAALSCSIDNVLSRAELGVSVAKASGGQRTGCGDWLHGCGYSDAIRAGRSLEAVQ